MKQYQKDQYFKLLIRKIQKRTDNPNDEIQILFTIYHYHLFHQNTIITIHDDKNSRPFDGQIRLNPLADINSELLEHMIHLYRKKKRIFKQYLDFQKVEEFLLNNNV